MTVLATTGVAESLRGRIGRWMLEIAPGVFVGRLSARVADRLWQETLASLGDGWAAMARRTNNDQGFVVRTAGDSRRTVEDFDGLQLVRFQMEDRSGDGRIRGQRRRLRSEEPA